jgi:hypothetical protein
MKLVKKIDGKAGQGVRGGDSPPLGLVTPVDKLTGARSAAGIVIDGVVTPLSGEPPIARTNGWGRVPGF